MILNHLQLQDILLQYNRIQNIAAPAAYATECHLSLTELQVQLHESDAILAVSGDSYPYATQFLPSDEVNHTGLYVDAIDGGFNSFMLEDFIDFTDPNGDLASRYWDRIFFRGRSLLQGRGLIDLGVEKDWNTGHSK
jgi:hypothetical protein